MSDQHEGLSKVEKLLQRKKYQNWTTEDAILWLEESLRLPQYKQTFEDIAIDGSMIDFITDQDLENDLQIKVRLHRVKIIEGIKRLKSNQENQQNREVSSTQVNPPVVQNQSAQHQNIQIQNNSEPHNQAQVFNSNQVPNQINSYIQQQPRDVIQQNHQQQQIPSGDMHMQQQNVDMAQNQNNNNLQMASSLVNAPPIATGPGNQHQMNVPNPFLNNQQNQQQNVPANNIQQYQGQIPNASLQQQPSYQMLGNNRPTGFNPNASYGVGQLSMSEHQPSNSNIQNGVRQQPDIRYSQQNPLTDLAQNNNNDDQINDQTVEQQAQAQQNLNQIRDMDILILKAVEGQLLNNVYVIGQNGAALGRHSASNDIVISESFVSRRHSEIKYIQSLGQGSSLQDPDSNNELGEIRNQADNDPGQNSSNFYLRDIGSTTGAFIMVRQEILLRENMMFQMGLSEFRIVTTSKNNLIELHVFEGPQRNRIITIDISGLTIGRDMQNSFYVQEDSQMSNFHAKITFHQGSQGNSGQPQMDSNNQKPTGFYLQDVGSTNRTWLRLSAEGEVSALHPLKINDIIKIGSTVFVVQNNDIATLRNMPIINRKIANQNVNQGRSGGQVGNGLIAQFQYQEEEKQNHVPGSAVQNASNENQQIQNNTNNNNQGPSQQQFSGSPNAAYNQGISNWPNQSSSNAQGSNNGNASNAQQQIPTQIIQQNQMQGQVQNQQIMQSNFIQGANGSDSYPGSMQNQIPNQNQVYSNNIYSGFGQGQNGASLGIRDQQNQPMSGVVMQGSGGRQQNIVPNGGGQAQHFDRRQQENGAGSQIMNAQPSSINNNGGNMIRMNNNANPPQYSFMQPNSGGNQSVQANGVQSAAIGESCKICYGAECDAAFIPCGHNFACVNCAQRCDACPVCRTPFEDIIKIYKQ